MNNLPTRINIESDKRFGEVAFLVDRDDFIADVKKIRKKLGINKLLSRQEAEKLWNKQHPVPAGSKTIYPFWKNSAIEKELEIDKDVKKLLKKYKKSWDFYNVIKYSISCGCVEDIDYADRPRIQGEFLIYGGEENKPCYYALPLPRDKIELFKNINTDIKLDETEAAIIVNPETKIEDLAACFRLLKKDVEKNYPCWKTPDTISNIKRDRDWYWLKKKTGLGYGKAFNLIENRKGITHEAFIKAIQQYKKRLSMEI